MPIDIQGKLAEHSDRFTRIEGELRAIKGHVGALVQSDLARDADVAALSVRVDRIERRLDLAD